MANMHVYFPQRALLQRLQRLPLRWRICASRISLTLALGTLSASAQTFNGGLADAAASAGHDAARTQGMLHVASLRQPRGAPCASTSIFRSRASVCRWLSWSSAVITTAFLWQLSQDKTATTNPVSALLHTHSAVEFGTLQSVHHTEHTQAARALAAPARLGSLRMGLGLLDHMLLKAMMND